MNLHRECDELMSRRQSGTYGTKEWRAKIIHNFINTLEDLAIAPKKLAEICERHIVAAVEHWREQKLSLKTIGNILSALRNFFKKSKLNILIPSNESLGVICSNARNQGHVDIAFNPDMLYQVSDPYVRNILAFEIYFGLTRRESIRIDIRVALVAVLQSDVLLIDRALADNRKDRVIPVLTTEQKKVISDRLAMLGDYIRLTELHSEKKLQAMITHELQQKGINPAKSFRKYYLQYRLPMLLKSLSRPIAMRRLRDEYGMVPKGFLGGQCE